MKRYEELYHDPQLFFLLGKTLCVEHTTPEEYARVMAPPPNAKRKPRKMNQEKTLPFHGSHFETVTLRIDSYVQGQYRSGRRRRHPMTDLTKSAGQP